MSAPLFITAASAAFDLPSEVLRVSKKNRPIMSPPIDQRALPTHTHAHVHTQVHTQVRDVIEEDIVRMCCGLRAPATTTGTGTGTGTGSARGTIRSRGSSSSGHGSTQTDLSQLHAYDPSSVRAFLCRTHYPRRGRWNSGSREKLLCHAYLAVLKQEWRTYTGTTAFQQYRQNVEARAGAEAEIPLVHAVNNNSSSGSSSTSSASNRNAAPNDHRSKQHEPGYASLPIKYRTIHLKLRKLQQAQRTQARTASSICAQLRHLSTLGVCMSHGFRVDSSNGAGAGIGEGCYDTPTCADASSVGSMGESIVSGAGPTSGPSYQSSAASISNNNSSVAKPRSTTNTRMENIPMQAILSLAPPTEWNRPSHHGQQSKSLSQSQSQARFDSTASRHVEMQENGRTGHSGKHVFSVKNQNQLRNQQQQQQSSSRLNVEHAATCLNSLKHTIHSREHWEHLSGTSLADEATYWRWLTTAVKEAELEVEMMEKQKEDQEEEVLQQQQQQEEEAQEPAAKGAHAHAHAQSCTKMPSQKADAFLQQIDSEFASSRSAVASLEHIIHHLLASDNQTSYTAEELVQTLEESEKLLHLHGLSCMPQARKPEQVALPSSQSQALQTSYMPVNLLKLKTHPGYLALLKVANSKKKKPPNNINAALKTLRERHMMAIEGTARASNKQCPYDITLSTAGFTQLKAVKRA